MNPKTIESAGPRSAVIGLDPLAVRKLLPHRAPLLMVDRVLAYFPDERRLVAIKNISQNEPFIQGHFPEYPIFPGVLTVESLLQAATILMHLDAYLQPGDGEVAVEELVRGFTPPCSVLAESRVKHVAPSYPGDQLTLEVHLTGVAGGVYSFKVRALAPDGEVVSHGRLSVARTADDLPDPDSGPPGGRT
jgi:3-hydroxyacyl-[acyl-carrier-protein] dehydratase